MNSNNHKVLQKIIVMLMITMGLSNVNAIELVCVGHQAQASNQRTIQVDCSDRKKVIDTLHSAWVTLRKERIGGNTEDMCWKPYNTARDIHPSIAMNNIAPTFLMQCNMALQYIK